MDRTEGRSLRLDWNLEILEVDKATGRVRFALTPDPDRYEWRGKGDDLALYDRLERIVFPMSVIESAIQKSVGLDIGFQPQTVGKIDEYIGRRMPDIRVELSGRFPSPTLQDESLAQLEQLVGLDHEFAIASLDLAGSTALSTALIPADYARLIQVYLYELSLLVTHFHGHVLKYTGDGLIAFFAAPSFIIKNDHALDYAACAIRLVLHGINLEAEKCGLPSLHVRAGIDSGSAAVAVVGHQSTKQHPDLIGKTVNLACKIQGLAPVDGVAIGDTACKHLHTRWRIQCSALEVPPTWPYKTSSGEPYPVQRLNLR